MEIAQTIDIAAPAERVWSVVADIERWPEWKPWLTSAERLDAGKLGVGGAYRIRGPSGPMIWRVAFWQDGHSFIWETSRPGLRSSSEQRVRPRPSGADFTVVARFSGPLAWVLRPLIARKTRAYLDTEIHALKQRAEARIDPEARSS